MDIALGVLIYIILLFSLSVHECAHAWTANRFGDPTAKNLGRVTLNPIPHIDIIGTVVLPLFMLFGPSGVPLFGWAKPVPVNPYNLRDPKRDHMWIAAAGPLSNFALCILAILLFRVLYVETTIGHSFPEPVANMLMLGALLNAVLGVFNLIPIPPLDGGGVIERFLPPAAQEKFEQIKPFGFMILLALMWFGVFAIIIAPVRAFIFFLMTVKI